MGFFTFTDCRTGRSVGYDNAPDGMVYCVLNPLGDNYITSSYSGYGNMGVELFEFLVDINRGRQILPNELPKKDRYGSDEHWENACERVRITNQLLQLVSEGATDDVLEREYHKYSSNTNWKYQIGVMLFFDENDNERKLMYPLKITFVRDGECVSYHDVKGVSLSTQSNRRYEYVGKTYPNK